MSEERKENIEEKLLEQNDNELNHDYVNNEVMRYDKLVDDKKGEIYHSKKFYMENCSRKRGFKLFLLLIVSNYLAHFFPGLIVPIAVLSLGTFLVDVIFLSKKHLYKFTFLKSSLGKTSINKFQ